MAHIVENNVLVTALEMQLENLRANVDILYKAKLKTFRIPHQVSKEDESPWVEVVLENGQTFSSRLLVRCYMYCKTAGALYYNTVYQKVPSAKI